jgi:hypothetical protein
MKPYGIKHKKSKLGIHSHDKCDCEVCNVGGWKKSKTRERSMANKDIDQEYELEIIKTEV